MSSADLVDTRYHLIRILNHYFIHFNTYLDIKKV